jgi:hypothetical protein
MTPGASLFQYTCMEPSAHFTKQSWAASYSSLGRTGTATSDNSRENLRWVSKSFNSWNCVRTDKRPSTVASRCPRRTRPGPGGMLAELTAHMLDTSTREAAIAAATTFTSRRTGRVQRPPRDRDHREGTAVSSRRCVFVATIVSETVPMTSIRA